ncbi:hypothetical protein O181_082779 [Austropuccinia psidii MF-1]|uniref:Uncharacterized protein n=1 Tax=Austropuccinia psidii MF-1 TaxID=1389203 RepID=A0A9Q3FQC4_9BASI|nr:hypothetical protein [Austropuccinia psidii MF-1]
MNLGVLRKVGHNEQVEVTTPVIITWHNDKSRMVGNFKALSTYTIPDKYELLKNAYDEGRLHLLDEIIYHRTKHTCVMTLTDRALINTILHELHNSHSKENLSPLAGEAGSTWVLTFALTLK